MLGALSCDARVRRTPAVVGPRGPPSPSPPWARSDTPIVFSPAASSGATAGPAHPRQARGTRPHACDRGGPGDRCRGHRPRAASQGTRPAASAVAPVRPGGPARRERPLLRATSAPGGRDVRGAKPGWPPSGSRESWVGGRPLRSFEAPGPAPVRAPATAASPQSDP